MHHIYLDHNATTPLDPLVTDEMERIARSALGNPASQHEPGRQARRLLEDARDAIGALLDINTGDRVVFTSGGTEANNWVLQGLLPTGGTLITSSIEHPSIAQWCNSAVEHNTIRVRYLPVSQEGVTVVDGIDERLLEGAQLVSVMLANNETGVIQPLEQVVEQCAARGVPVHTDAVQAVGKISVSFRRLGASAMTIAAHKFHGPIGIGALILKKHVPIRPLLLGGFQQAGLRPGTESVVLAVGMWKALERFANEAANREVRMRMLRDRFEELITQSLPCASIIGRSAPRVPHTSNIAFEGCDRQALVMALDVRGVACSTGSACASGSSEPSPVLLAMNLPRAIVNGSIRFSLGAFTTDDEIAAAARWIIACVQQAAGN